MKKFLVALAVLASALGVACLWDYDTLRMEAAGKMDVVHVITGRFERWPDRYYEMRLERMEADLKKGGLPPVEELDRYDNAGVALDRLKRHDEAVAIIERKLERLKSLDPERKTLADHWYRYFANAGTFYAHRWFSNGADREKMADLERGRELIAKAIELNPGAHFGREDVQLMIMDWVINIAPGRSLGNHLASVQKNRASSEHTRKGLLGLVMLGNAWESIDVFESIATLSNRPLNEGAIGELALERVRELKAAGRVSIADSTYDYSKHSSPARIQAEYKELREDADAWAKEREAFVLKRLGEGKHPDTHKDFWEGYRERPPRKLDADTLMHHLERIQRRPDFLAVPFFCTLSSIAIAVYVWKRFHKKSAKQIN